MRVLMLSKACIVGIYQRKLEAIARRGVELMVLVPPSWKDERGEMALERAYTEGYALQVVPIHLNGNFHLHFYRDLARHLRAFRPHIVHIDEEPYNLSCWQALYHARHIRAKALFFSWQNIARAYPPPFAWGERWVLDHADHAIVGTDGAAGVWRRKGFRRGIDVIAQFGVDPDLFRPAESRPQQPFTIGAVARLVPEKGIHLLVQACAALDGDWRLRIVGGGPQRAALETCAHDLGIAAHVEFVGQVPSAHMPTLFPTFDVLVVPSLTRPNWKEQFGPRATVEAMASGVPVIGSDSGAIPDVIGDAGVIVPENHIAALTDAIQHLRQHPAERARLARAGRARVLARYTHDQIAAATVAVYHRIL
jgi:glycosyltransferase involved in cell wall biosynthesis